MFSQHRSAFRLHLTPFIETLLKLLQVKRGFRTNPSPCSVNATGKFVTFLRRFYTAPESCKCSLKSSFHQGRNNILLLGDNVGDSEMLKSVENVQTSLNIGFLNDNVRHTKLLNHNHNIYRSPHNLISPYSNLADLSSYGLLPPSFLSTKIGSHFYH